MASELQITANQRNALKGTGPRSVEGKERSSHNATKHGLTTGDRLLPGEDPEEFNRFRLAITRQLAPIGELELELVERSAHLLWRMRRIEVFETALLKWEAYHQLKRHDLPNSRFVDSWSLRDVTTVEEGLNDNSLGDLKMGRAIDALVRTNKLGKLSRYETTLQRQLSSTLKELRELQAQRPQAQLSLQSNVDRVVKPDKVAKAEIIFHHQPKAE